MDNVGIVVENLDEIIHFFTELGLKLQGKGEWAGRVTGLGNQNQSGQALYQKRTLKKEWSITRLWLSLNNITALALFI